MHSNIKKTDLVLFFFICAWCLGLMCVHACWRWLLVTHTDRRLLVFFSGPKKTEDYHGSNTIFLVGTLMSVVGGVFIVFATMALCYRSVVVHKNFSLCLRLVSRRTKVAIHVFSQHLASDYFFQHYACLYQKHTN